MGTSETPLIIRSRWRAREIERMTRPMFNEDLTAQAVAGHLRSTRARVARHQKRWGLFADIVPLPEPPTLEEHREKQRLASIQRFHEARDKWASDWRRARKRLRELPRQRAAELLEEWNSATGIRAGRRGPDDLLYFLADREPTPETLQTRRHVRLRSAAIHIESARRTFTWYVAHRSCPEGDLGAVALPVPGYPALRCIACEKSWRSKSAVSEAEASGELAIIDCRLAEQIDLF